MIIYDPAKWDGGLKNWDSVTEEHIFGMVMVFCTLSRISGKEG